jgi:outer membrane protein OmpA-like peptidoglycan-associated protein
MNSKKISIFIISVCIAVLLHSTLFGQSRNNEPEWWYGGAVGVNFNYYGGQVQTLNAGTTSLAPFTRGAGIGIYLAPLVEYHPDPVWGGMLQLGYDGRRGSFDEVSAGGGNASLSTSLSYLSLEPSLRIAPFPSAVYFFAGPHVGFNISKSFTYTQTGQSDVNGDWSGARGAVLGGQVGIGYDVALSDASASSQLKLSPFLAVHFGQGPRSEETWSLTSVRMGLSLKFGSTASGSGSESEGGVQFSVKAPKVIPIERRVKETFPMRNFVFFDESSNSIPNRYVVLTKDQATSFKEDQLLEAQPKDLTGRSRRQMTAYHNVLNVLGDRMRGNRNATVTLTGSSDQGAANGKALAEAVKSYLVNVFDIDEQRIKTDGREKPSIPSFQSGGTREVELVRPEDRRVEITSSSVELLEPLQIISLQEDPLDSDVQLNAIGAENTLASWSIEVSDDAGNVKRYGPFTGEHERVSGRAILGDKLQGQYKVALVGETKNGQSFRKEETVRLVRTDQPDEDLGLRFSILFEFDQSKTVATYERFLTGTVAPLIPEGASVTIHGHTDIIGEESHNLKLSRDRANETQSVLERALSRAGKRRVKFDTYGFGEDIRRAPFENRLPEERFYNRTVIIDIVPE